MGNIVKIALRKHLEKMGKSVFQVRSWSQNEMFPHKAILEVEIWQFYFQDQCSVKKKIQLIHHGWYL